MENKTIDLYTLLNSISKAQDLASPRLFNHHQQVAYLSYKLAEKMDFTMEERTDIFMAAIIHDVGALSKNERLEIIEKEPLNINNHAFVGAKLLEELKPMKNISTMIKFHHISWDYGMGNTYKDEIVPCGSHVIHLADRICTMLNKKTNVLSQIPQIVNHLNLKSNIQFEPKSIAAMNELSNKEFIWLDLVSNFPAEKINTTMFKTSELDIDEITELVFIFSRIIDFRSRFTAQHSAGVAKIAEQLAKLKGFSIFECKMMLIAGYLHDLGKLAIDNEILEKPGKLSEDEFNEVRSHTYFTYQLLDTIPQFKMIKEWASYHHERVDGNGYPFHIEGESLSIGSRIMAVADVFTAITEDRPYRVGMNDSQAIRVLTSMVLSGALDGDVVKILVDNFQMLKGIREKSQQEAVREYERILLVEAV
ncbi:MAG: HD domain-containing phosphohydrolase [Lachnotalea sp.]